LNTWCTSFPSKIKIRRKNLQKNIWSGGYVILEKCVGAGGLRETEINETEAYQIPRTGYGNWWPCLDVILAERYYIFMTLFHLQYCI